MVIFYNNEFSTLLSRISVAEKLYQRDLETALQISLSNSPSEKEEQSHLVKKAKTKNVITIKGKNNTKIYKIY